MTCSILSPNSLQISLVSFWAILAVELQFPHTTPALWCHYGWCQYDDFFNTLAVNLIADKQFQSAPAMYGTATRWAGTS